MKLHNNKENRLLVNMAQELAHDIEVVSDIKNEIIGKNEVSSYEMAEIALYISNKYANMCTHPDHPDDNEINNLIHSADQQNYFNNNIGEIVRQYFENQLPPISFKNNQINGYMTVGDIRHSEYDDETPIINVDYSDNVSHGTPYKQDMYTCSNVGISEVYVNADDLYLLEKGPDDISIGCTKNPDSVCTIKAITF